MINGLVGITSKDKIVPYASLVAARKSCRLCPDVINPSACTGGKFDAHGHIGAWSDWQGHLDAEMMVVGQEWGGEENFEQQSGRDADHDPTNEILPI